MNKSISELEGWKWKSKVPGPDDSYVERRFYELHNKRLSSLTISDIRFLLIQETALEYLVPMGLKILSKDLFIESEYFQGDLFCSLVQIRTNPDFWTKYPKFKTDVISLFERNKRELTLLDTDDRKRIEVYYNDFLNGRKTIYIPGM